MRWRDLASLLASGDAEYVRERLIAMMSEVRVECPCISATVDRLPCAVRPCDCAGRCTRCGGRVNVSEHYR